MTRRAWIGFLFRLLGGLAGPRNAPGIILLLGLRNPLERGLVGLLVHFRLFLLRLLCVALMPFAAHLRMRWQRDQRQHCRRNGEGPHRLSLSAIPDAELTLQTAARDSPLQVGLPQFLMAICWRI